MPEGKAARSREVVRLLNHAHALFYRGQRRKALATLSLLFTGDFDGDDLDRSAHLLEVQFGLELGDTRLAKKLITNLLQHSSGQKACEEEIATLKLLEARLQTEPIASLHLPEEVVRRPIPLQHAILGLDRSIRQHDSASVNSALVQLAGIYNTGNNHWKCLIHHAFGCAHAVHLGNYEGAESRWCTWEVQPLLSFKLALQLRRRESEVAVQISTLIHHLSLTMLAKGDAAEAFRLLISLVPHYPNDPRFWLRMAECCAHAQNVSIHKLKIDDRATRACRVVLEATSSASSCREPIPEIKRCAEFGVYAAERALSLLSKQAEKGGSYIHQSYDYQTTLAYFYAVLGRYEALAKLLTELLKRNDIPFATARIAMWMKMAMEVRSGVTSPVVNPSLNAPDCSTPHLAYNSALLDAVMGRYAESSESLDRIDSATDVDLAGRVESLKTYLDMQQRRAQLAKQFFGRR